MVTCAFCGDIETCELDAIYDGWIPSFWERDGVREHDKPVCPDCIPLCLEKIDGEFSLRENIALPVEDDEVVSEPLIANPFDAVQFAPE